MVSQENIIGILAGPTATGKTSLAIKLCQAYGNIEILNADSLLIYRFLNIGTAKPTSQERESVPHHLIDIRNPDEPFTAAEFMKTALATIEEIHARNRKVLIVGGTGFYLNALLFGVWNAPGANTTLRSELEKLSNQALLQELESSDPQSARKISLQDRYRLIRALEIIRLTGQTPSALQAQLPKVPSPRWKLWILDRPRSDLDKRIQLRTHQMLCQGFIEEYKAVCSQYPHSRALSSVGYAQVSNYLQNKQPTGRKTQPGIAGLEEEISLATRQLVKRQRTWFRNQCLRVPNAQWFLLDEQRQQLEEAFKKVYE